MHLFIIHVMHLSTQIKGTTSSSEKNVENELPEQKSYIFPVNFLKTKYVL